MHAPQNMQATVVVRMINGHLFADLLQRADMWLTLPTILENYRHHRPIVGCTRTSP